MNSTTQQAVAQAVRVQRVRSGIPSEAALARKAGYSTSALNKRLSGDIRLDLNDVERLAAALDVDPFALMALAEAERRTIAA